MPLAGRDKKALLALVEHAQVVYLLTRYPKKQVLDDEGDAKRLEDGLAGMRDAAKDLSASLRERTTGVQWDELAKKPDTSDLAWRKAKHLAPEALRELMPLLEGEPEAAFFLRPEAPPKKTKTAKKTKTTAKTKPRRAGGGRRSQNGSPSR